MEKFLDLSMISSEAEFHDLVSSVFGFPNYYGRNLDAFSDCISDLPKNLRIKITGLNSLEGDLSSFVRKYINVLTEIGAEPQNNWQIENA